MKCTGEVCKIDLNRELFHVSPHAGKDGTLAWLKSLEDIRETQQEKIEAHQLYEEVKGAK